MARLGLSDGDRVRLTGEEGQTVQVCIVLAKKDELPGGLLFIAYGDIIQPFDGRRYSQFRHAHQQKHGSHNGACAEGLRLVQV
jgi:hypothetical protein